MEGFLNFPKSPEYRLLSLSKLEVSKPIEVHQAVAGMMTMSDGHYKIEPRNKE